MVVYLGFEKGDMDSFSIRSLSLAFFLLRVAASSRPRVSLFVGFLFPKGSARPFKPSARQH
jgi:hypothetical protein